MLPKYRLNLTILKEQYAVCRLPAGSEIPAWDTSGSFYSVSSTEQEVSIVCQQAKVPAGILLEGDWRCIRVEGPLAFTQIGLLASLLVPLSQAEISIFAISTYDTDYLLLKEKDLETAVYTLMEAGHFIARR